MGIFAEKNVSSFCKNIGIYDIFNDQSFSDSLTNDVVSFEQLGPGFLSVSWKNVFLMTTFMKII